MVSALARLLKIVGDASYSSWRHMGDMFETSRKAAQLFLRRQIAELDVHHLTLKGLRFCRFYAALIALIFQLYAAIAEFPNKIDENLLRTAVFTTATVFAFTCLTTIVVIISSNDRACCQTLKEYIDIIVSGTAFAIAVARLVVHQNSNEHVVSIITSISTVGACLSALLVAYDDRVTKKTIIRHQGRLYYPITRQINGIWGNETVQELTEIPPEQIVEMLEQSPIKLPVTQRSPPLPPRGSGYLHNIKYRCYQLGGLTS